MPDARSLPNTSDKPRRWTFEGTVFKHMPDQFVGTHVEGPWVASGEAVEVVEASAYDGAFYALQVLVAMADENELAGLESTLTDERCTAARDALVAARAKVAQDIENYRGEEG